MTFKHKLSRRLAMLKDAWLVLALAASGCEKPSTLTDPPATIRLHIAPKSVTLPTDGATQLLAVALTSAGDSTTLPVNWSVTGGSIANTSTSGVRNYADYKATSQTGVFKVIASGGGSYSTVSDTATVTVLAVPVATVQVAPASAGIATGQTQQLAVTLKDSAGGTLTGRVVTWASSNGSVASVTSGGPVAGVALGSTTITATSEGKSATAAITVQASLPGGSLADPTLLPVASGQLSNVAAYAALNVVNQPAGFSYRDPVTGVKVWKVTSSSVPMANSNAGHDYSDGPNEVSLGWGSNNNTHTILIRGDGMAYYLVDFTRGAGFSNYRRLTVQPARDLCFTFSNLASQPRIAYILTGSQVVRFNTATMQTQNTGNFPLNQAGFGWLQHDKTDGWFAGLTTDQTVVFAWNSRPTSCAPTGRAG